MVDMLSQKINEPTIVMTSLLNIGVNLDAKVIIFLYEDITYQSTMWPFFMG